MALASLGSTTYKAGPLAARRGAALIALTLKQLDGDCRELLREYAPVLVTVKVPEEKVDRSRRVSDRTTRRKVKVVGLPQVLLVTLSRSM